MPVDRGYRWSWKGEESQVCSTVLVEPLTHRSAAHRSEKREVVVEVQPGRERAPLAGEDQRSLRKFVFQPVERGVHVAEEGRILSVGFIGVHRDGGHSVVVLDSPGHVCLLRSQFQVWQSNTSYHYQ